MFDQFIGTKAVEERHRFDVDALPHYLKERIDGLRGPLQVEQFKGGQSNPTYRLAGADGKKYVLRRKPPGRLLPSAHAVDREYRVIRALHAAGFPVAKPYLLCEDESVIGTAFYVMDNVEGRVLWDQSLPGMSRAQRAAIWDELNDVIAKLHLVDCRAVGLEGFGKPGNYIERQVGRWTKQYLASETQAVEAMNNLIEWLPKNIPPETGTTVVHGDFRLANAIFPPTQPQIPEVPARELATLGAPLADFAYHCMSWHIPPGAFRGIAGLDLEALGIPDEETYVQSYCRRTGRGPIDPSHWAFYIAYNLFRISAILQGILKRVVDGTAASAHARDAGMRAKPMGELGGEQGAK